MGWGEGLDTLNNLVLSNTHTIGLILLQDSCITQHVLEVEFNVITLIQNSVHYLNRQFCILIK